MTTQLNNQDSTMSKFTLKNASVSIVLAILMIGFSLARTALTSRAFGVESLGLLTIIIGILPYLSSSHNGLTSVGTSALYSDIHTKNYTRASQTIADIKVQYYLFGVFYLTITLIIAFAFPFIINGDGTILIKEPTPSKILWYQSSLFILSNGVELIAFYFVVPISLILLFITKKSYISNAFSMLLTIILNSIIIVLYAMIINGQINLSFIEMNIIVLIILGSKMFFLLSILYFYRKRYFPWYQKQPISSFKVRKESIQAVGSQYLEQFSTDLTAIVFMVYAALNTNSLPSQSSGDPSSGGNDFVPSAIYTTYILILVSINEIVHSIIDAAIPSVAEHATFNKFKINKHTFHRYQVLSVYIVIFTISSYILTSGLAQAIFLHDDNSMHVESNKFNIILIATLWLPMVFQIFNNTYSHLMPIFGMFNVLLKKSVYEVLLNIVIVTIISVILFFTASGTWLMNGIFLALIAGSLCANLLGYIIAKKKLQLHLIKDACVNLWCSTLACFGWIIICLIVTIPVYLVYANQINHLIETIGTTSMIMTCIGIVFINLFISMGWVYIFRKQDFLYYFNGLQNAFKKQLN